MSGTDLTVQNIPYQVQSPSCELSGTRTSPAFFVQFKGQVYVAKKMELERRAWGQG